MFAHDHPPFGATLRRCRVAARLTQEELAERAGLSANAISALERGVNLSPQQGTLDLLVDALGLRLDDAATPRVSARRQAAVQSPERTNGIAGPTWRPTSDGGRIPVRTPSCNVTSPRV